MSATAVWFSGGGASHLGTVRTNNEDAALFSSHLVALADGMGGHAAGEVASAVVMDCLTTLVRERPAPDADSLLAALHRARTALRAMSQADPVSTGMGTTVVALAAGPAGITLAHVGDSRLYRLRAGVLTQLTVDHTHVQRLVESGRLAPEQVHTHPFRSVILRSLDDSSEDLPDVTATDRVQIGDRLLLCSDGLSDYVPDDAVAGVLRTGGPQEAAGALVQLALRFSTRDNVTAVVLDVCGDGERLGAGAELLPATDDGASRLPAGLTTVGTSLAEVDVSAAARAALARVLAEPLDLAPVDAGSTDRTDSDTPVGDTATVTAAARPEPSPDEPAPPPPLQPADPPAAVVPESAPSGADSRTPALRAADIGWLGLLLVVFVLVTVGVWFLDG